MTTNFCTHNFRSKSPLKIAAMIIFGAIAILALMALFGFVVMWLWNWLMPEIFGLTTLTFWQSVGIIALSKLLLGGGGFGKGHKHSKKSKFDSTRNHKNDFSKWKHYDTFWKEEGSEAYNAFVKRQEEELNKD